MLRLIDWLSQAKRLGSNFGAAVAVFGAVGAAAPAIAAQPNLGPNVTIFSPSTPLSQIQAALNAAATQQIPNQFGLQRYAFLFEPGVYGSVATPLNFQVGYYTAVAGLGRSPGDVVINGSIDVYNQCDASGSCVALNNFWRSMSNLTINVTKPNAGCRSNEFWAVSQAAPMRRVMVNGSLTLMDYCTGPSFASGGFIADSAFAGGTVINGSQQQWMVRNSNLDGWTNGVWNQVFSGVIGAPAQCFPAQANCGPYTTVAASPVTREAPYLYVDSNGGYNVFVPAVQRNSVGPTWWAAGATPGTSVPLAKFYIARPSDSVETINDALESGKNLILTPGVYNLRRTLKVERPNTVVLGLGFPTLIPKDGAAAMRVEGDSGDLISGIIFDAGPVNSSVLLQLGGDGGRGDGERGDRGRGEGGHAGSVANPSALHDVFFRIGGASAGSATRSLVVNSDNAILDDVWAWRADHGAGVGWTSNTADTGLIVNGDNVTAYGLFVEHYQKYEVIWRGEGGATIFFQNEMPYDPPSQAAWMESPTVKGWAAFKVADRVKRFSGYGMGSYSLFTQGVDVFADNAFEVPTNLPLGSFHDLLTIFLNATAKGGILHVINNTGGSSTIANPDSPVTVLSYP